MFHSREEGFPAGLFPLPYLLVYTKERPSQAVSTGAIICLASLEQQNEVSADLSGELLYLETLIGYDSK